jgi:hypothetical protein
MTVKEFRDLGARLLLGMLSAIAIAALGAGLYVVIHFIIKFW